MLVAGLPIDLVEDTIPDSCAIPSEAGFTPASPPPMGGQPSEGSKLHNQTIGAALMICEAGSYRVGIPWLPPTAPVQRRVEKYSPPVEEFIRLSLVGVPTAALESYAEDLETMRADGSIVPLTEAAALGLELPNAFERYSFSVLLFGIFFCTDFLMSSVLEVAAGVSLFSALVVGGFALIAGLFLSEERYRRRAFHCVVTREILRRRGLDQPGANGIPIAPVG